MQKEFTTKKTRLLLLHPYTCIQLEIIIIFALQEYVLSGAPERTRVKKQMKMDGERFHSNRGGGRRFHRLHSHVVVKANKAVVSRVCTHQPNPSAIARNSKTATKTQQNKPHLPTYLHTKITLLQGRCYYYTLTGNPKFWSILI